MDSILVVEDHQSMAQMLKTVLQGAGFQVLLARDALEAAKCLRAQRVDLVLTDLKLPGQDGMEVLRVSREEDPSRPVVMMTAYGSIQKAVQAMKQGAYDFITKPFDTEHLVMLLRRALEAQRLRAENLLLKEASAPSIVGRSRALQEALRMLQRIAPTKGTVLILGESGTGKELFARAIHALSPRKDAPFVPINCAAIPRELMEAELFGYERGAFTGAEASKPGRLELAHRGTVFFDEVGELELALQAKLLRVLQEGELQRIGSVKTLKVDVRVIAASNQDLEALVAQGRFREDLYYRLNVLPLRVPPLRERPEDIPLLAEHFLAKYTRELKTGPKELSQEALRCLLGHRWKGNVRELQNAIERAVILCDGGLIMPEHLGLEGTPSRQEVETLQEVARSAQRAAEAEHIRQALARTGGNKSKAAELLGVSYKTLLSKLKDYGIE